MGESRWGNFVLTHRGGMLLGSALHLLCRCERNAAGPEGYCCGPSHPTSGNGILFARVCTLPPPPLPPSLPPILTSRHFVTNWNFVYYVAKEMLVVTLPTAPIAFSQPDCP